MSDDHVADNNHLEEHKQQQHPSLNESKLNNGRSDPLLINSQNDMMNGNEASTHSDETSEKTDDNQNNEHQEEDDDLPPLDDVMINNHNGDGTQTKTGAEKKRKYNLSLEKKEDVITDSDGCVDILDNKQLLKKIIKAGDGNSSRPERTCRVVISMKTRVKETQVEVPSETFESKEAFVGDYDLIHGVDLSLPLMHLGEVSLITIHPRFAFGSEGKDPDVPPDATLECEVQLKECEWIDSESQLPLEKRIKYGMLHDYT